MDKNKVLIVENELIVSLDIKNRLNSFGYCVTDTVTGSHGALESVVNNPPHIVIMDIRIDGELDGISTAAQIKHEYNIPVIFLTAYSDDEIIEKAKRAEPAGYILKPFKERELVAAIDSALYKHRLETDLQEKQKWFQAILRSTGDAIVALNGKGYVEFMNPVAERLTGIDSDDAIGVKAEKILIFKDRQEMVYSEAEGNLFQDETLFEAKLMNRISGQYNHVSGNIAHINNESNSCEGRVLAFRDISNMQELFQKINYQSSHDSLTGLINRKNFIQKLSEIIERAKQERSLHGLLVLGLDRFKVINETCGHIAGDDLLRKISYTLRTNDTLCETVIGRIGGDEFGILFSDKNFDEIKLLSRRIRKTICDENFIWGERVFPVKASFGLVPITETSHNHHLVLAAADDACSLAKEKGGDKIEIYNQKDTVFDQRRGEMQWISRLKRAMERDQLVLYYQEIESSGIRKPEEPRKIEILVRIKEDDNTIISPGDFINSAERYGLMPDIDRLILKKSMEACRTLLDNTSVKDRFIFSINISGTSIPDETLPDYIKSMFKKYNVPPELFCFELTETAAITNLSVARNFINNLRELGCTFALDDFGSGFSNFAYLKNIPVDYLKIDGVFIRDMLDDPINKAMVESINNIGHIMNMNTVAEFVKNSEIKKALIELGIDFLQGYEINKPTPIEHLTGVKEL